MPRTWRAGGIIGPTTAKQNAEEGGVADNSAEELEKLEKFFVKVLEAEEIADKIAGEGEAVRDKRAGGARETDETRRRGRSVSLGPVFNHLPQLVDRPRRLLIRV